MGIQIRGAEGILPEPDWAARAPWWRVIRAHIVSGAENTGESRILKCCPVREVALLAGQCAPRTRVCSPQWARNAKFSAWPLAGDQWARARVCVCVGPSTGQQTQGRPSASARASSARTRSGARVPCTASASAPLPTADLLVRKQRCMREQEKPRLTQYCWHTQGSRCSEPRPISDAGEIPH